MIINPSYYIATTAIVGTLLEIASNIDHMSMALPYSVSLFFLHSSFFAVSVLSHNFKDNIFFSQNHFLSLFFLWLSEQSWHHTTLRVKVLEQDFLKSPPFKFCDISYWSRSSKMVKYLFSKGGWTWKRIHRLQLLDATQVRRHRHLHHHRHLRHYRHHRHLHCHCDCDCDHADSKQIILIRRYEIAVALDLTERQVLKFQKAIFFSIFLICTIGGQVQIFWRKKPFFVFF